MLVCCHTHSRALFFVCAPAPPGGRDLRPRARPRNRSWRAQAAAPLTESAAALFVRCSAVPRVRAPVLSAARPRVAVGRACGRAWAWLTPGPRGSPVASPWKRCVIDLMSLAGSPAAVLQDVAAGSLAGRYRPPRRARSRMSLGRRRRRRRPLGGASPGGSRRCALRPRQRPLRCPDSRALARRRLSVARGLREEGFARRLGTAVERLFTHAHARTQTHTHSHSHSHAHIPTYPDTRTYAA